MSKIVIGIDQSYKRTGITVLCDKEIFLMRSVNYEHCKNNSERRTVLTNVLDEVMEQINKENLKGEITVITERIRLFSKQFISESYIKATGALVATIIDFFEYYNEIPVYSVETKSWKSQVVGSSKPLENPYGISPEKYRTIVYLRDRGFLKYIVEEYRGRGKKGVLSVKIDGQKVPCKINDDLADSLCIAMYGFLPKHKQKLQEEKF